MVNGSVLLNFIDALPNLSAAPVVSIILASSGVVSGYLRRRSAEITIERPSWEERVRCRCCHCSGPCGSGPKLVRAILSIGGLYVSMIK